MKPKKYSNISLIIPAHNEEKYIGTCLEHVIKNSNGKFLEIIVVDNASTDDSIAQIKKAHPDIKILQQTENLGVAGVMHADDVSVIPVRARPSAPWWKLFFGTLWTAAFGFCLSALRPWTRRYGFMIMPPFV